MMQKKPTDIQQQSTKDSPNSALNLLKAIEQEESRDIADAEREESERNAAIAQEEWRDISWMDVSGSFKIFLSSKGRLKVQLKASKDSSGRTAVKFSGEEILLDYLVASVFPERVNNRLNSEEVSHKDGNLQNNAAENLRWLINVYYKGRIGMSTENADNKLRHFIFPENASEKVPTDYMVRTLLDNIRKKYPEIIEDWIEDIVNGISSLKDRTELYDTRPEKDGVLINPRSIQTIDRKMKSNNRQLCMDMREILRETLDEYYSKKGDITTPVFDTSESVMYPNNTRKLPESEIITGNVNKNGTFRLLQIPDGYTVVAKIGKDGKKRFFVVNEQLYNQATRIFDYMDEYGSGERALAKELTGDENADIKLRKNMWNSKKLCDMPSYDNKPKTGVVTVPNLDDNEEVDTTNNVVDRIIEHAIDRDNDLSRIEYKSRGVKMGTQRKKDRIINEQIESGKMDDIIRTLRRMSVENMRQLRLKRGDRVDVNPDGHAPGKPIVMVDPINGRTQDFPSITKAIEFAGCTYNQMRECLCGRRRHINGMQYQFKYVGDAAHILSGIYLAYMRLIEERKEELESISDDDFEKLSEELDALEKTTLAEESGEEEKKTE
jgi:hypothetical protein